MVVYDLEAFSPRSLHALRMLFLATVLGGRLHFSSTADYDRTSDAHGSLSPNQINSPFFSPFVAVIEDSLPYSAFCLNKTFVWNNEGVLLQLQVSLTASYEILF